MQLVGFLLSLSSEGLRQGQLVGYFCMCLTNLTFVFDKFYICIWPISYLYLTNIIFVLALVLVNVSDWAPGAVGLGRRTLVTSGSIQKVLYCAYVCSCCILHFSYFCVLHCACCILRCSCFIVHTCVQFAFCVFHIFLCFIVHVACCVFHVFCRSQI